MPAEPDFDVQATLNPVRRTLGLSRLGLFALRGFLAGSIAAVTVLGLAHLHPVAPAIPLALAFLALGLLAGIAAGIRSWPHPIEAARLVDRRFGLADRLTTALELRASATPVARLQRASAAASLDGLPLRSGARFYPRREELALGAVALIAVAALMFSAMPDSTSAAPTDRQGQRLITRAAHTLPALRKKAHSNLTPAQQNSPALRKLDAALATLQRQLRHAGSRSAALRSISLTQEQIHRIAAGLHPLSPRAVAGLNRSLSSYMRQQQRQEASKSSSALAATAQTLNRLAAQLARMSAAQKARLARALARSANATADSAMRSRLQQAASSLAYGDPQSAAQSLRQAAALAQAGPGAAAAASKLAQASSSLDSLKSGIAGLPGKPGGGQSAPGSGQGGKSGSGGGSGQGAGKGSGVGKSSGSGTGSGTGAGTGNGTGTGKGSGSRSGRGHGSGSGQGRGQGGTGGSGGHGLGGGPGRSGPTGKGHYATVYVAGKERNGPKTTQTGPNGAPAAGSIVPYQQVVSSYTNQARTALGASALTPSQRQAVQRYFSRISR
jgi:hypothetical protein